MKIKVSVPATSANVGSGFDALQVRHERHARSAVRMHDYRQADSILQRRHKVVCSLRSQDSGHVLDAY